MQASQREGGREHPVGDVDLVVCVVRCRTGGVQGGNISCLCAALIVRAQSAAWRVAFLSECLWHSRMGTRT